MYVKSLTESTYNDFQMIVLNLIKEPHLTIKECKVLLYNTFTCINQNRAVQKKGDEADYASSNQSH